MSPDEREGCGAPHSEAAEELVLAATPADAATAAAAPTDGSPRWIEPRRLTAEPLAGDVSALSVSSDGRWVAAGTDDGELLLMRAPAVASSGVADAIVWRAAAHLAAVTCVRFADGAALAGGAELASSGEDGTCAAWRTRLPEAAAAAAAAARRRTFLEAKATFAADVKACRAGAAAEGGDAELARRWELDCEHADLVHIVRPPGATRRPAGLAGLSVAAASLPNGSHAVPGGGGGGEWVPIVAAVAVEPSNSGRLAAAVGRSVYLLLDDGPLAQLHASATVCALGYARRRRLLCASGYGGVRVWSDFGLGPAVARLLPFKGPLEAMDVAADERYVACGAQDATLVVWPLDRADRSGGGGGGGGGDDGGGGGGAAAFVEAAASDGPSGEGAAAACGGAALFFGGAYERKVGPVAWDPSGRLLASAGGRSAVVWDLGRRGAPPPVRRNGRSALLIGGDATVTWLGFAPATAAADADGGDDRRPRTLAAAGGGRVLLYEVRPPPPPPADRDAADGGGGDAAAWRMPGTHAPVAECAVGGRRRGVMAADQVMAWGRGGWLFGAAGDAVLAWPTRREGQPAHEEDPTGAAVWDSGRLLEALLMSEDGRAAVGAPPAPTRVLELGAGTGDLAHALARALPSISRYHATDLPERAAAIAGTAVVRAAPLRWGDAGALAKLGGDFSLVVGADLLYWPGHVDIFGADNLEPLADTLAASLRGGGALGLLAYRKRDAAREAAFCELCRARGLTVAECDDAVVRRYAPAQERDPDGGRGLGLLILTCSV
jgi:hypothetical protein